MHWSSWGDTEVAEWLSLIQCAEYADVFREHHIRGDVLECLDADALMQIGIARVGDRLRILKSLHLVTQVPLPSAAYEHVNASDLPADVLALIFALLDHRDLSRCAATCRSWHRCAFDPRFWTVIECSPSARSKSRLIRSDPLSSLDAPHSPAHARQLHFDDHNARSSPLPSGDTPRSSGRHTAITDDVLTILLRRATATTALFLSHCGLLTSAGLRPLAALHSVLTVLDLTGCASLTGGSMFLLSQLTSLTGLSLRSCCQIPSRDLERLDGLRQLHTLDLSFTQVDSYVIECLGHGLPSLQKLVVKRVSGFDYALLQALAEVTQLTSLTYKDKWLHRDNFVPGVLPTIGSLTNCVHLDLRHMEFLGHAEDLHVFERLTALRSLKLGILEPGSFDFLCPLTGLTRLKIEKELDCNDYSLATSLQCLPLLEVVSLQYNVEDFWCHVPILPRVRYLSYADSEMEQECFDAMVDALVAFPCLQELRLEMWNNKNLRLEQLVRLRQLTKLRLELVDAALQEDVSVLLCGLPYTEIEIKR